MYIRHAQSHPHLLKHSLVPVSLWVATYSTLQHAYWTIAVITGICIATYLQYATSKNSNVHTSFNYLLGLTQIAIWVILVSSCDPVSILDTKLITWDWKLR